MEASLEITFPLQLLSKIYSIFYEGNITKIGVVFLDTAGM